MKDLMDHPLIVLVAAFLALWAAVHIGAYLSMRASLREHERPEVGVVLSAALTLLALLIGFSFSMAANRYEQRRDNEEHEANAIGTEYLRVGILPASNSTVARKLLRAYLEQRLLFYTTQDPHRLDVVNTKTAQIQNKLWLTVQGPAAMTPSPITSLIASGMNDVIDAEGYTQAGFWNRVPPEAWGLMVAVAVCCALLFGYNAQRVDGKIRRAFMIPLIVSIALFLIADLDSPRNGFIRVPSPNLQSLAASINP